MRTVLAIIAVVLLWVYVVWHISTPTDGEGEAPPVGIQAGVVVGPEATGRAVPIPPARPVASPRADRSRRNGGEFILDTTAYTWTGHRTASGIWPRSGVAASNLFPLGTRLLVQGIGEVLVEDRIGWGSQLDIYMDSEHECIEFGRKRLHVTVIR